MRFALLIVLFSTVFIGCGSKPPPPPPAPAPAPAPPPPPPAPSPDDAKDIDPSVNPDAGNEAEDEEKTEKAAEPGEPAALLWFIPAQRRG